MKRKFFNEYGLIKEKFDPKEIYVRSTSVSRVIESAQSNLMGMFEGEGPSLPDEIDEAMLYPPLKGYNKTQGKGSALPGAFQPVPIEVIPGSTDKEMESFFKCPSFLGYLNNAAKSTPYSILRKKTVETRMAVAKFLNLPSGIANINDTFYFYDDLKAEMFAGIPLPSNLTNKNLEDLEMISNVGMYFGFFGSKTQQKLGSGFLLKQILAYFDNFLNKKSDLKLVIFSGHDTNIVSLLNALDITNPLCRLYFSKSQCYEYPPFASSILLELIEDESQYFVRLIFNGETLKLYGYDEFIKKAQSIIPENYDELCQGTQKIKE